jgi:hypothetical protein
VSTKSVQIDCARIVDWDSFHDVFCQEFGFPDFYGRNMDAWIDCMSYVDDPAAEMTSLHIGHGDTLTIVLRGAHSFLKRCPDLHAELVECLACVNQRLDPLGEPRLSLDHAG